MESNEQRAEAIRQRETPGSPIPVAGMVKIVREQRAQIRKQNAELTRLRAELESVRAAQKQNELAMCAELAAVTEKMDMWKKSAGDEAKTVNHLRSELTGMGILQTRLDETRIERDELRGKLEALTHYDELMRDPEEQGGEVMENIEYVEHWLREKCDQALKPDIPMVTVSERSIRPVLDELTRLRAELEETKITEQKLQGVIEVANNNCKRRDETIDELRGNLEAAQNTNEFLWDLLKQAGKMIRRGIKTMNRVGWEKGETDEQWIHAARIFVDTEITERDKMSADCPVRKVLEG